MACACFLAYSLWCTKTCRHYDQMHRPSNKAAAPIAAIRSSARPHLRWLVAAPGPGQVSTRRLLRYPLRQDLGFCHRRHAQVLAVTRAATDPNTFQVSQDLRRRTRASGLFWEKGLLPATIKRYHRLRAPLQPSRSLQSSVEQAGRSPCNLLTAEQRLRCRKQARTT